MSPARNAIVVRIHEGARWGGTSGCSLLLMEKEVKKEKNEKTVCNSTDSDISDTDSVKHACFSPSRTCAYRPA